ncbi:hypothetical protein LB456_05960 [Psychroflexus sp. CAK57W]|uniref:hypothetical protein n=1 Tax=Psychroflexus curvus TaxID=2873595 RepID=UPI001CCD7C1C|nr:hypothetical protein [Psychroflexus curvus]MBZ9786999.1 hypothetical protein [Psychroflexus curvus]
MNLEEISYKSRSLKIKSKTHLLIEHAQYYFFLLDDFTLNKLHEHIYEVDTCIEVYNPNLKEDVYLLRELSAELHNLFELKAGITLEEYCKRKNESRN